MSSILVINGRLEKGNYFVSGNTWGKIRAMINDEGKNIESAWDKEKQPDQWKALIDIIKERNPQKIGLDYSKHFGGLIE